MTQPACASASAMDILVAVYKCDIHGIITTHQPTALSQLQCPSVRVGLLTERYCGGWSAIRERESERERGREGGVSE